LREKEHRFDGNLRKETWVHPEGGVRVHRTAPLDVSTLSKHHDSSDEDEELDHLDASELNKRFIISFLHVQGKLITKIGYAIKNLVHLRVTKLLIYKQNGVVSNVCDADDEGISSAPPHLTDSHQFAPLAAANFTQHLCHRLQCAQLH
jgi:hypothetical protein